MKKGSTLKENIAKVYGPGPIQYQRGWTEFYKLKFKLTPDVLIPRPETELLVDEILKWANSESQMADRKSTPISDMRPAISVLEIGTGSGCIAISVAKNLPQAKFIATDISKPALEIAKQNAKLHHLESKIIFLQADLLSFIKTGSKAPDIIAANLPYIPSANLMLIDPLVAEFEPKIALDGGQDGFELYRQLFRQIRDHQFFPQFLMIEIDDTQSEIAPLEAKRYFPQAQIELKKDLNKIDRFLIVKF